MALVLVLLVGVPLAISQSPTSSPTKLICGDGSDVFDTFESPLVNVRLQQSLELSIVPVFRVSSPDECAQACLDNPLCLAFEFKQGTSQKRCALKSFGSSTLINTGKNKFFLYNKIVDIANCPTVSPTTVFPTRTPTWTPSMSPSTSMPTTLVPTLSPTTRGPTESGITFYPTMTPTTSQPTSGPTASPTSSPTSNNPTGAPSSSPTETPSKSPTPSPTSLTCPGNAFASFKPVLAGQKLVNSAENRLATSVTRLTREECVDLCRNTDNCLSVEYKFGGTDVTRCIMKTKTVAEAGGTTINSLYDLYDRRVDSCTDSPTISPTISPSTSPTSSDPTSSPTLSPTAPTVFPTESPTSSNPSLSPTSADPTSSPSLTPTSADPTSAPSANPSSSDPTSAPTVAPITTHPTYSPSIGPTLSVPTSSPSHFPTLSDPTTSPTQSPSLSPTVSDPTSSPTSSPTVDACSLLGCSYDCNFCGLAELLLERYIGASPSRERRSLVIKAHILASQGNQFQSHNEMVNTTDIDTVVDILEMDEIQSRENRAAEINFRERRCILSSGSGSGSGSGEEPEEPFAYQKHWGNCPTVTQMYFEIFEEEIEAIFGADGGRVEPCSAVTAIIETIFDEPDPSDLKCGWDSVAQVCVGGDSRITTTNADAFELLEANSGDCSRYTFAPTTSSPTNAPSWEPPTETDEIAELQQLTTCRAYRAGLSIDSTGYTKISEILDKELIPGLTLRNILRAFITGLIRNVQHRSSGWYIGIHNLQGNMNQDCDPQTLAIEQNIEQHAVGEIDYSTSSTSNILLPIVITIVVGLLIVMIIVSVRINRSSVQPHSIKTLDTPYLQTPIPISDRLSAPQDTKSAWGSHTQIGATNTGASLSHYYPHTQTLE